MEFTDHVMIVIVKLCLCVGEKRGNIFIGRVENKIIENRSSISSTFIIFIREYLIQFSCCFVKNKAPHVVLL